MICETRVFKKGVGKAPHPALGGKYIFNNFTKTKNDRWKKRERLPFERIMK
jgi:hypothetical protein